MGVWMNQWLDAWTVVAARRSLNLADGRGFVSLLDVAYQSIVNDQIRVIISTKCNAALIISNSVLQCTVAILTEVLCKLKGPDPIGLLRQRLILL